ncbi:putative transposase (plasmid) [Deinococcus gobiensis I-0]|uniref:Putative transposase n=1 Tax=Deinococcus gobiensis (strain DSM 21396 / JCM 16679 / CGMCC 1.7299 / I-0) TaxID=745776 RepID=H8H264_DEIGI|nr:putative transposase [Deinococcus gobiensis I-0]
MVGNAPEMTSRT